MSLLKILATPVASNVLFKLPKRVIKPQLISYKDSVQVMRTIGNTYLADLDPFIILEEFKSSTPDDYKAGFPLHPHRGLETLTIMIHGKFKHEDTKGKTGVISSGGVQWMSAGKGIRHSEMPVIDQNDPFMWGLQLWLNMPAKLKMSEPQYEEIEADGIPTFELENCGMQVRLISGQFQDITGALKKVTTRPTLMDITLPEGQYFEHEIPQGNNLFVYNMEGQTRISADDTLIEPGNVCIFDPSVGNAINMRASPTGKSRFLLGYGKPCGEPIVRVGPYVMNSMEEILKAKEDFNNGVF